MEPTQDVIDAIYREKVLRGAACRSRPNFLPGRRSSKMFANAWPPACGGKTHPPMKRPSASSCGNAWDDSNG